MKKRTVKALNLRPLATSEVITKISIAPDNITLCEEGECLQRLIEGDTWAHCVVTVTVSWYGLSGVDILGGCSYKDEADFTASGGYFDNMQAEALKELNNKVLHLFNAIWKRLKNAPEIAGADHDWEAS